jgi:voltage-gated potassium channel
MSFMDLIGLGGAPPGSPEVAKRMERAFNGPMTLIAFAIIPIVFIEMSLPAADPLREWLFVGDALIWGAFVAEYIVMVALTKKPWEYTKRNWLNVFIILVSIPNILPPAFSTIMALRALRGLRALRVFAATGILYCSVEKVLEKNGFGYFLAITVLVMLLGATVMPLVDPKIPTAVDGLWFTFKSMTNLGEYDASLPSNPIGKGITAVAVVLGIVLISLLTANISANFVEKDSEDEFSTIIHKLETIEKRLDHIEKRK